MYKKPVLWLVSAILVCIGAAFGMSYFPVDRKPMPVTAPAAEQEVVLEPETQVTLLAVGDIMLARKVESLMADYGRGYPLSEVKDRLSQADVTFGNLECAISDGGEPLPGKGIWLRAEPEVMSEIKASGFSVLSVANNHSLDYDYEAFLDTLSWLKRFEIAQVGGGKNIQAAQAPHIITVEGVRIGFLAYTEMADLIWSYEYPRQLKATETQPGVAPYVYDAVLQDVQVLRDNVDLVVLSLHWGTEYSSSPSGLQREQARGLIDAGADIVIGHHPHVVQGLEVYKDGLIAYSLGNFVFDQNQSRRTQEGLALEVKATKSGIGAVKLFPVIIRESQPRFEQTEWAKALTEEVQQYSLALGTGSTIQENPLEISFVVKQK